MGGRLGRGMAKNLNQCQVGMDFLRSAPVATGARRPGHCYPTVLRTGHQDTAWIRVAGAVAYHPQQGVQRRQVAADFTHNAGQAALGKVVNVGKVRMRKRHQAGHVDG